MTLPAGTGASALAIRERRPVTTTDILTDPRITLLSDLRALIERSPHRSVMSVPLVVKDVVIGALAVADRAGRIFDEEEIRITQAFADQAALALDNARLYEEAHQRVRHLDSLRAVVEQILVPISLEERLTVIAGKAAELFDADRATIALRDEGRDALVVRAGHRIAEGEVGRELRPDASILSLAASTRAGALVNDYHAWPQRDPYVIQTYTERPALAVIGYPLMIRDQLIGAISVGRHTPGRTFVRADLDRLASLAVPAALAIEHSRLYEELEQRVRELEATQAQLLQAGKLSAVGQLVSGVAHELNNPLSVILGYAQLLSGADLPADLRRPVEMMLAQGGRMAKIVQSLLLFSRQRRPSAAPSTCARPSSSRSACARRSSCCRVFASARPTARACPPLKATPISFSRCSST
jgi:GAF domain-containing protein